MVGHEKILVEGHVLDFICGQLLATQNNIIGAIGKKNDVIRGIRLPIDALCLTSGKSLVIFTLMS
jgi:hypothetical protein